MRAAEERAAYLFLLPNLLGFLAFGSFPILATLAISLAAWDVLSPPRFVGLGNYAELAGDKLFRQVVGNTLAYVLGVVPLTMGLGLGLALALNGRLWGRALWRTAFFLPVVISSVAAAVVWRWLYNTDFGLANAMLGQVGLPAVPWISSSDWAMPSAILASVWKGLGYDVLVFLAGLQAIDRALYEAADLDGASRWQRLRHVVLPLLAPTTLFVLVVELVRAFQMFDLAYVLTGGGPANATNTLALFVYQVGFQQLRMGYAAAAAWTLFAIVFAITLLRSRRQAGWVPYD